MHIRGKTIPLLALFVAALMGLTGCAVETDNTDGAAADPEEPLTVYATTMYLADAVAHIDPEAEITTMVGPGADPHTYQLSTKDIERLEDADAVVWNGLYLEAVAADILRTQGSRQRALAEELDTAELVPWEDAEVDGAPEDVLYDPHVWNNPRLWAQVVEHTAEFLAERRPDNREEYLANAEAYAEEIIAADAWAQDRLATIPEEQRLLITGHDAFVYLGQTYELEIRATDFISSEAELSASELSELADVIAEREVPVIFHDNQKNPQAIRSLKEAVHSRGWDVEISEHELFADSMGSAPDVDHYLGAFKHNVNAIADALGEAE